VTTKTSTYNPNSRLREAARKKDTVKSVTTLPKSSGPEVIVKFQRPMPCVIILVHGVNDVGEAYRHQAKGLCEGLNLRLERPDLVPGDWDVPQQCGTAQEYSYARRIADQGRNPIIPFYWGYRPVDKATYDADKKRYEAELKARGPAAAEAPYDAYYIDKSTDPRSGHENTDNFNNRIDKLYCKNGGVFANATSNLIDMWGPGASILGLARLASNHAIPLLGNQGDYSHSIFENPHRIYMVNAAQRLADLIVKIRRNPATADDSINIVAHSQGTLVAMLANFIVKNIEQERPADCVIFNHSPYSMIEPYIEGLQARSSSQQTQSARVATFANFCKLMDDAKLAGPSLAEIDQSGIASLSTLQKKGHARDNHGKVYNYFCPHDRTVSLRSVQGIGWQGVPTQWMGQFGSAFKQRMFFQGELVLGERIIPFPRVSLPTVTSAEAPTGEKRSLNGEALPANISYTFHLPAGCTLMGPSDHGVDEAARGAQKVRVNIDDPRDVQTRLQEKVHGIAPMSDTALHDLESRLQAQGHDWTLIDAIVAWPGRLSITRYQTKEEMRAETRNKGSTDSFHSAIVNSEEASKYVTSFDLAIGRCKSYDFHKTDGGAFWQELLKHADWRLSREKDDFPYSTQGILPRKIKLQMNKPPKMDGIKNETTNSAALDRSNAEMKIRNAALGVLTK
jgi:hypothetical protein